MSDPIIGIDLGTSNTVVGYADATGAVRVLADESGAKIHPSVVSFHPSGGVVVGSAAKQRKVIDPKNTIFSVKRLIGRSWTSSEVQTAKQRMPYEIKEGQNQLPTVVTRGGEFAVPEISAIVLDHARNIAASQLQTEIARAVVTVPASFNDAQRSATATAGSIAGLTVVRVLNEPTAAALAYGHARNLKQTIAVYDFGGGTFDITILKLDDQVYEVLGTSGDTFLGGDDLDERLVDRMVEKFLAENRIDLRTNEVSMMRLRAVAEQTKIELSRRTRAVVRIDEIAYGPKGRPLDLQIEITRDEFVKLVADIIDKSFPVCEEALKIAGLKLSGIDDVLLVGGTSKIPYVRDQVSKFFAKAPRTDVNPEEAVAVGAALQASALDRILSRKPSKSLPRVDPAESDTQTGTFGERIEDTDASITKPAAELPFPEIPTETTSDDIELIAPDDAPRVAPRATAGYSQNAPRSADRPVEKGRTVDRIGTPGTAIPAATQPIGRLKPSEPRRTSIGVAAAADEEPTGTQPTARAMPGAPPIARPPVPPTRTTDRPAAAQVAPRIVEKPTPAQVQGRITDRGVPPPVVPAVPTAAPQAKTLIGAPTTSSFDDLDAATTTRGPGAATGDAGIQPDTTARGFAPPQSYPVLPPAAAAPRAAPPPRAPVVIDVTPRGLGIGTVAGYCEELIRRNSRVPTEIRKLFTTSRDAQAVVRIIVCQGESRRLDDNTVIGDLMLEDIPPRPRGETSIEVTFQLDASGILQVRARDAQTGKEQRASLDLVGAMAASDVATSRDRLQQLRRD